MGSHIWLLRRMGQTKLIVIFAFAVARSTALQCYQCDSTTDGPEACNDDPANRGELKTCPPEQNAGCFIIEIIKGELDADVIRGCTDIKNEELYKCSAHEVGQHFYTACNCHGDGCNSDWESAGDTYTKALECYECTSIGYDDEPGGNCSDSQPGGKMRCGPGHTGCFISKSTSAKGDVVTMERGCTMTPCEDRFKCQTLDSQGGTELQYCNCHGSGCNENWDTAGSSGGSSAGGLRPMEMIFLALVGILPIMSTLSQ